MFLTENPWVELFECQAEVFDWITQAYAGIKVLATANSIL